MKPQQTIHSYEVLNSLPRVGSPSEPPQSFSRIVLEQLDKNLFLARKEDLWRPSGRNVIFGGQVIGQSLSAATRTVKPDKDLHSCHCYFLVGGKNTSNIIYSVLVLQEGNSFSSRLVTAQQEGRPIFICICSFQKPEQSSLVHQYRMPMCPPPENLITAEEYYLTLAQDPRCSEQLKVYFQERAKRERDNLIELRFVLVSDPFFTYRLSKEDGNIATSADEHSLSKQLEYPRFTKETKQLVWFKSKQLLSDDPNDHRSVLGYVSDLFLLGAAVNAKVPISEISMIASRDHSIWFHSNDFRMDEWMLYDLESPRAAATRGLAIGRIFKRNGEHAVSVTQEGVVRLRKDRKSINDLATLSESKASTSSKPSKI